MNDSNLKYAIMNAYGIAPTKGEIENIKSAIKLDDKEDHAFCRKMIRDKVDQKAKEGGKMPEGTHF